MVHGGSTGGNRGVPTVEGMPSTLTLVTILIAAAVCVYLFVAVRARTARHRRVAALPKGAEAILWSVTEVLPDPRNHLAIKDPTSELRLSDDERRAAEAIQPRLIGGSRPAQLAAAEKAREARRVALEKHGRPVRHAS